MSFFDFFPNIVNKIGSIILEGGVSNTILNRDEIDQAITGISFSH